MFASNNKIYAWQASSDERIETLQLINHRKLEPQISIIPNTCQLTMTTSDYPIHLLCTLVVQA